MLQAAGQQQDSKASASRKTISFAAGLQPLAVAQHDEQDSIFRSSALLAATPHVPASHKVFTDRCTSRLASGAVQRPATTLGPAVRRRSQSPPLLVERRRCSTAPLALPGRLRSFSAEVTSLLPEVLQFETWWHEKGQLQKQSIDFHTASKEFRVRGPGGREMWLRMAGGAGEALEQWDLHVGAELDVLGRKVVLRKASCSTIAWLDGWTRLLLQHKQRLEGQLSKFTPVIQGPELLRRDRPPCMVGEAGLQANPTELVATGGRVNLRHLREDIAFAAWRLRQHKATVHLPPELADLQPEGPAVWSIPGVAHSPTIHNPFAGLATCKTPHYATAHQLLHRSFKQQGSCRQSLSSQELPALGETPNGLQALIAFNRVNLWEYIQSNPLAASAAVDRRNYRVADSARQAPGALQVQTPGAGSGGQGGKTPGPVTGRRANTGRSRGVSSLG